MAPTSPSASASARWWRLPQPPPDREAIASALVSASAPQGAKREDVASRHASVWSRQLGRAPRLTMTTRRSCRVTKGPRSLARECPRLRARRRGQKKSLRCQVRAKGQRQQGWERGRRRGPSHPCHAPSESRCGRRGLRGCPDCCRRTASGRQRCGLRMRGGCGGEHRAAFFGSRRVVGTYTPGEAVDENTAWSQQRRRRSGRTAHTTHQHQLMQYWLR